MSNLSEAWPQREAVCFSGTQDLSLRKLSNQGGGDNMKKIQMKFHRKTVSKAEIKSKDVL